MSYYDSKQKMRVAMCLIYLDSAPSDWLLRLRNWHIPAAVSPLHDRDTWDTDKYSITYKVDSDGDIILKDGKPVPMVDENGEIIRILRHKKGEYKKAHYHVMLAYGNSTTAKVFMRIINDIGGVVHDWDHMEVCSVPAMYRYFAHLDDKDKFQYDINDVILLGGFDPINYQTYVEKNEPFNDCLKVLKEHPEIRDYRSLAYYFKGRDNRLFYFVMNHTLALTGIFKSDQYTNTEKRKEHRKIV